MGRGVFRIKDQFASKAKIVEISQFHFGDFTYQPSSGVGEPPIINFNRKPGWWPKLPVLIRGNGLPWEIGNAYLLNIVETKRPWDMGTIRSKAHYLLAYLRFLEDSEMDYMDFPLRKSERVTYIFRDKLQEFIAGGLNPLYASNIMNTVVDFYRKISEGGLVEKEVFENLPFKDSSRFIRFIDDRGFSKFKKVKTSDLAIRHAKPQRRMDRIEDGGRLRPLSIKEQRIIFRGFDEELCPYNLELMMKVALNTGARLQTVCTLRVCHIKEAYRKIFEENLDEVEIQAGYGSSNQGHLINTKNGKLNRLIFTKKLVVDLYVYMNSEYHQNLMSNSYYGMTDVNYLFLTNNCSPYYISKQEILDRQNDRSNDAVNSEDFTQNRGDTVRVNLTKFKSKLKSKGYEIGDFRFHDLRATFGMNLVIAMSEMGVGSARILSEVQSRMGHNNIEVTQSYLDFRGLYDRYDRVAIKYDDEMFGSLSIVD